jgi:hypothetical protein
LVGLERRLAGIEAQEAIVLSLRQALVTVRLDKAERFGRVIGTTAAQEAPNWGEAAEFIRTLEEFTDADIEALKLLWTVQRKSWRVVTGAARREMTTDANDYTSTWPSVLDAAEKAGVSRDDWYSRCGRLGGFGLAGLVQSNPGYQGTGDMCYRVTGRAVRLLQLLGDFSHPEKYPTWRYHATEPARIVNTIEEDRALGSGWADTPNAFQRT